MHSIKGAATSTTWSASSVNTRLQVNLTIVSMCLSSFELEESGLYSLELYSLLLLDSIRWSCPYYDFLIQKSGTAAAAASCQQQGILFCSSNTELYSAISSSNRELYSGAATGNIFRSSNSLPTGNYHIQQQQQQTMFGSSNRQLCSLTQYTQWAAWLWWWQRDE